MAGIGFIMRFARSREQRFVLLLRPHLELMYRMAYRWTQSREDAEDLVQDVLLKLLDRVEEIEALDAPRPWLIRVLYRRYVDLYRRRRSSPVKDPGWRADLRTLEEQAGDDNAAVMQLELRQSLLRALETLDENQRDVILLHDAEGYTALETAEILDISVGTVKSRLHRARQHLKKVLAPGTL